MMVDDGHGITSPALEPAGGHRHGEGLSEFETGDWLLLLQAAGSITVLINRALRPFALNRDTWLLLESVREQPRRPSEMAQLVGGLIGSVCRRIDRLHGQGLVDIQSSADDNRAKTVSITVAGARVLDEARNGIAIAFGPVSGWLGDVESSRVATYHRRLAQVVRSRTRSTTD